MDNVLRQCRGCVIPQSFLVTTTGQVSSFTDHSATESGQIAMPRHAHCQPAVPPESTLSSSLSSSRQPAGHQGYQLLFAQGNREHSFPCKVVIAMITVLKFLELSLCSYCLHKVTGNTVSMRTYHCYDYCA